MNTPTADDVVVVVAPAGAELIWVESNPPSEENAWLSFLPLKTNGGGRTGRAVQWKGNCHICEGNVQGGSLGRFEAHLGGCSDLCGFALPRRNGLRPAGWRRAATVSVRQPPTRRDVKIIKIAT